MFLDVVDIRRQDLVVVMKRRLQAVCLGMESEEIIILFPSRVVLALANEKCSVQPGLDVSYQEVPKVPSRLGPRSFSDGGTLPRLFCSVAAGPPLCLPKVDSQSGNTPAVVCAALCISLVFEQTSESGFTGKCHAYVHAENRGELCQQT